jgi:hypothetical protein
MYPERDISEADWKVFRPLRQLALDRFCERILAEARLLVSGPLASSHERYITLYRMMRRQDKELARRFDGFSRSRATNQLLWFRHDKLLTDEEFARFSPEFQKKIEGWLTMLTDQPSAGESEDEDDEEEE